MKIFNYLRNTGTGEVHRLKHATKACGLRYATNIKRCTRVWAWYLIKFRAYNGCRHCYTNKDNG